MSAETEPSPHWLTVETLLTTSLLKTKVPHCCDLHSRERPWNRFPCSWPLGFVLLLATYSGPLPAFLGWGSFLSVLPDSLGFLCVGLWFDYVGISHFSESQICVWHFFKVLLAKVFPVESKDEKNVFSPSF